MSEETFDRIAGEYDESLPPHVVAHYLDKRTRYLTHHSPRGSSGLDVGCGTGVLAQRLAAGGYEMVGLDPSEGMLDVLAERAPDVRAVRGSGTELPFEDASFDLVFTVAALHHIADPVGVRATLGEMVRVTRLGGRIVIWDHNPRNPYWKRLMAKVPQDDGTERLIPEAEILEGLRSAGGLPISSEQLGLVPDFVPPLMLGAAARLERAAERTPGLRRLCAHNVVLATRT